MDEECPECTAPDRDYTRPYELCGAVALLAPRETDAQAVEVTPAPVWVPEPRGDA